MTKIEDCSAGSDRKTWAWVLGAAVVGSAAAATIYYCYPDQIHDGINWSAERVRRFVVRSGLLPSRLTAWLPASARKWLYDTPNSMGTTGFQHMIRDGDLSSARRLIQGIDPSTLSTNPTVTREMFHAVSSSTGQELLAQVDLEQIPWDALEIGQNCALTSIRLKDGSLLRLPGVEALDVYQQLLTRKYGSEIAGKVGAIFTAHVNPEHAFIHAKTANGIAQTMGHYAQVDKPSGILAPFFRAFNWITGIEPGHLPQLVFSRHPAYISDEIITGQKWINEATAQMQLHFVLNETQATALQELIAKRNADPEHYRYLMENCVDFVQTMYSKGAGLQGHFADHMTQEQIAARTGLISLIQNRALLYARLCAKGTQELLRDLAGL